MKGLTTLIARGRYLVAATVTAVAVAALPGTALAETCDHNGFFGQNPDPSLVDGLGFSWDLDQLGEVGDGFNNAAGRDDAFDGFGEVVLSADDGATLAFPGNADPQGCSTELDGRQIVYPADTSAVPGVRVERKVFVPASGLAFARWLDSFTNTTAATETLVMRWGGNLGSDFNTVVATTSNGDGDVTAADHSAETFQAPLNDSDPLVNVVWDGPVDPPQRALHAGLFDFSHAGFNPSVDDLAAEYSVTLAPGETKRYLHVVAMRLDRAGQMAANAAIEQQPAALRVGLSVDELATIQNWSFDPDHDGVLEADNCPSAANPGQEDLDGDGQGDACDSDIDGDALSNNVEASLGTNPRAADSDGDGRPDGADACPAIGADSQNGCPPPVVLPPAPDHTPPVASVAVRRASFSIARLLKQGLTIRVSANEPAAFRFDLIATAKSAHLARAGDLVVASQALGSGTGTRTVKLVIAKRWRRAITRKTRLTLRTEATDQSANRAISSRHLKLTR